ncbi:Tim44-like domain-containing protein [Limnobacter humi]|uniref:Tim44-like domain-containing protein n=1 Tax=Limnobacter humi TaxID=1778671 RepID=A0ABT1WEQ0_9BURK|nr:Tim44-like domain-containing protein [Limnobacter humi]MCQ8894894.1 Tim44-like domain-containing protein [Limnobacter humi]
MNVSFLNRALSLLTVMLFSLAMLPMEAEAKRMGGGSSFGKTAPSYSRQASPSNPAGSPTASPTAPTRAAPAPAPTAPTAAQPQRNRFLGPLMGFAAGLGLAALFSHLGFGEGMAQFLGTALMVLLAVFLVRKLFSLMRGQTTQQPSPAYSSAGQQTNTYRAPVQQPTAMDGQFGNPRAAFDAPAALPTPEQGLVKTLPAGFDEAAFIQSAKKFFTTMQGLFDQGDLQGLREYCTDDVMNHLRAQVEERGIAVNKTDVVTLQAELIGFEVDVDEQIATVAYSAMLRESAGAAAEQVDEVWVLTRPMSGGGWLLAGIHNL